MRTSTGTPVTAVGARPLVTAGLLAMTAGLAVIAFMPASGRGSERCVQYRPAGRWRFLTVEMKGHIP